MSRAQNLAKLSMAFLNSLSPLVHLWLQTHRILTPLLILTSLPPTPYLVTQIMLQSDYHLIFIYVFGIHVVFVINFLLFNLLSFLPTTVFLLLQKLGCGSLFLIMKLYHVAIKFLERIDLQGEAVSCWLLKMI